MVIINDIADLKNRTLVESNTLKSMILAEQGGDYSSSYSSYPSFSPKMDDMLIHNYQIANSVTLNSILLNFITDIQ